MGVRGDHFKQVTLEDLHFKQVTLEDLLNATVTWRLQVLAAGSFRLTSFRSTMPPCPGQKQLDIHFRAQPGRLAES